MPIFRVKSEKIDTGQKKFTRAPLVVLVTNIRYVTTITININHSITRSVIVNQYDSATLECTAKGSPQVKTQNCCYFLDRNRNYRNGTFIAFL